MILFFRALCGLLAYDILNSFCPFRTLHAMVKSWKVSNRSTTQNDVNRVSRAVNYACAWYPKQALCLQRSFVTTYLLRKAGVSAQVVLGAQKLPFKAHAWVEVNGQAINERSDVQSAYAVWERC